MRTSDPDHRDEYGGPRRSAVLAVCAVLVVAVLPWLAPGVPRALGHLVGGDPKAAVVQDPPVLPPSTSAASSPGGSDTAEPARPASVDLTGKQLAQAGRPEHLSVARLSVDSAVVPISGQSGVLLPPSDPQLLGWWREGARPGAATGTAVLTGHTVHTGGGAFDHLRLLVPRDRMVVRTSRGRIHYDVASVRVYSTAALARHNTEVFRLGGPGRLVLITCSDWNGSSYDTNTVVVARPVSAPS